MSDTAPHVEIEDLLASVRRLVSAERSDRREDGRAPAASSAKPSDRPAGVSPGAGKAPADRLVLTADLRVAGGDDRDGSPTGNAKGTGAARPVEVETPGFDDGAADDGSDTVPSLSGRPGSEPSAAGAGGAHPDAPVAEASGGNASDSPAAALAGKPPRPGRPGSSRWKNALRSSRPRW